VPNGLPFVICLRDLHNIFTEDPIGKVYEGYCGKPNSGFFHMNGIVDGIMRKGTWSNKLTEFLRGERLVDQGHVFQRSFGRMRKTLKLSTRIMVLLMAILTQKDS